MLQNDCKYYKLNVNNIAQFFAKHPNRAPMFQIHLFTLHVRVWSLTYICVSKLAVTDGRRQTDRHVSDPIRVRLFPFEVRSPKKNIKKWADSYKFKQLSGWNLLVSIDYYLFLGTKILLNIFVERSEKYYSSLYKTKMCIKLDTTINRLLWRIWRFIKLLVCMAILLTLS